MSTSFMRDRATRGAWCLFLVSLSGITTPALRAQDASVIASIDALGDERTRAAVRTIFQDAIAKGIPTAPLVTKLREGIAKQAEPERIRTATALLAQRLASAVVALAPSRSTEELSAGADALQAGVVVGTLREMRRIWPVKPLTVPLGVLAELVVSGVPQSTATRRVRELLIQGANTAQLAALGTNVRADVAAGLAPDASLELRSKGVLSLLLQQNVTGLSSTAPNQPLPTRPIRPTPRR